MSRSCPSCGSAVSEELATCPVCGETLDTGATGAGNTGALASATEDRPEMAEAVAPVRPATGPSAAPATAEGQPIVCSECGAANLPGAVFCSSCGMRLTPAGEESRGKRAAVARAPKSSHMRDYLLAGVAAIVIAGIVLLVFTPEERMGPPVVEQAGAGAEGVPPGHPPMDQPPAPTPEQQQQMAALEKQIQEHPEDADAKLKLADLYYNLERYAEAIPLYQQYLEKNPENVNARTDMAYAIANNGAIDSAIVELYRVIREDPKHQNATYNLTMMYAAKRDRDSTLHWLDRVVQIDSTTQPGRQAADILAEVRKAHPPAGDSAAKSQ
jgi:cytochrome c-type biogenesis protein CcmH/NrfG